MASLMYRRIIWESFEDDILRWFKRYPNTSYKRSTKPQDPTVMFDDSEIKLKEVRDFVHKIRKSSAPGLNRISYKLYKNCPRVLRKVTVLLQQAWKKDIIPQEWCLTDGIWIPKEMKSRGSQIFAQYSS